MTTASFKNYTSNISEQVWRAAGAFRRWWLAELDAILAHRLSQRLMGTSRLTLYICPTSDSIELRVAQPHRTTSLAAALKQADFLNQPLTGHLERLGLQADEIDTVLILPRDQFFEREISLPAAALSNLHEVIARDLVRRTPFRLDEIHQGYSYKPNTSGAQIVVQHLIIKRELVETALTRLRLNQTDIGFVTSDSTPDDTASPRVSLPHNRRKMRWYWSTSLGLLASALVLSLLVLGATTWRQHSTISELDQKIESLRATSQQVRSQIAALEKRQAAIIRIQTDKITMPGLVDTWKQVTMTLPSHSWLAELAISGTPDTSDAQVSLIGYSESSASLVGLFEKSGFFKEAALTSPIVVDPSEKRERFSIKMKSALSPNVTQSSSR